jgi:hypothetical protein
MLLIVNYGLQTNHGQFVALPPTMAWKVCNLPRIMYSLFIVNSKNNNNEYSIIVVII